jgi:hypothetical protein
MRLLGGMMGLLFVLAADHASIAQQRNSASNYLQQGYEIINSTVGGMYLVLILKKDTALVLCSVTIETGQTAGCQTIK